METQEVQEPQKAEIHENVLKAQRLVRNFVNKDTEAVLVLKGNGRYAILDLQASKAGKYQLRPDELLNERWREVIPRPPKVDKNSPPIPAVVKLMQRVVPEELEAAEKVLLDTAIGTLPNPVIPPALEVGAEAAVTLSPPETVIKTQDFAVPVPVAKKVVTDAPNPSRKISGKQS